MRLDESNHILVSVAVFAGCIAICTIDFFTDALIFPLTPLSLLGVFACSAYLVVDGRILLKGRVKWSIFVACLGALLSFGYLGYYFLDFTQTYRINL